MSQRAKDVLSNDQLAITNLIQTEPIVGFRVVGLSDPKTSITERDGRGLDEHLLVSMVAHQEDIVDAEWHTISDNQPLSRPTQGRFPPAKRPNKDDIPDFLKNRRHANPTPQESTQTNSTAAPIIIIAPDSQNQSPLIIIPSTNPTSPLQPLAPDERARVDIEHNITKRIDRGLPVIQERFGVHAQTVDGGHAQANLTNPVTGDNFNFRAGEGGSVVLATVKSQTPFNQEIVTIARFSSGGGNASGTIGSYGEVSVYGPSSVAKISKHTYGGITDAGIDLERISKGSIVELSGHQVRITGIVPSDQGIIGKLINCTKNTVYLTNSRGELVGYYYEKI